MLMQAKTDKVLDAKSNSTANKARDLNWSGWMLQLGRNEEGTFGVWTFQGKPVLMVRAGQA
jgi:hypothetical protein